METILITLFIVASLINLVRLSLTNKVILIMGYALILGIFLYSTYPWLIEQNTKYIETLLTQPTLMNNLALVVILETLIIIGGVFVMVRQHFQEQQRKIYLGLKYVPTLTPFLAIAYLQLQAYYFVSDYTFEQITWGIIIISSGGTIVIIKAIQLLISEWEIRLELTFILALVQIIIGIVISSYYNSIASTSIVNNEVWQPFIVIIGATIFFALLGIAYARYKMKKLYQSNT